MSIGRGTGVALIAFCVALMHPPHLTLGSSPPASASEREAARRCPSQQPGELVWNTDAPCLRARLAVSEIYSIMVVLEQVVMTKGSYPDTGNRSVELREVLSATGSVDLARVPALDPWHEPYRYWSDGKRYVVVSGGADKRISLGPLDALNCGADSEELAADIIGETGLLCRATAGARHF